MKLYIVSTIKFAYLNSRKLRKSPLKLWRGVLQNRGELKQEISRLRKQCLLSQNLKQKKSDFRLRLKSF
jgi:hypothetical protein